jgi:hypothetical protein
MKAGRKIPVMNRRLVLPISSNQDEQQEAMMKIKQCMAGAVMVMAGAVMAEEIFKEGFNSGYVPPFLAAPKSFGFQFVNYAPNGKHEVNGTEGDGYGWQNHNNSQQGVKASVIGRMTIDLGTVKEAGVEYIFTGDFAWQFGSEACARDLYIHKDRTGFRIEEKTRGAESNWLIGDAAEKVWRTYTVRYTTRPDDVGQKVVFEIQLADSNQAAGLTQILTDNWKIEILQPLVVGAVDGLYNQGLLAAVGR